MTQQHNSNSGNFANDREKAARAGEAGREHSAGNKHDHERAAPDQTGRQHGGGNFKNDPERAAEAGRKGGSH